MTRPPVAGHGELVMTWYAAKPVNVDLPFSTRGEGPENGSIADR